MIDKLLIARHAVWIVGAAIVLAMWSDRRVHRFEGPARVVCGIGGILFCAGVALNVPPWQAIVFWVPLAVWAGFETIRWQRQPH